MYVPCFVLQENQIVISVVSILKPRFKCLIYPASWNFNRFTSSSFSVVSRSALCLTQFSADINMYILLTILYIFLMVLIGKSWLKNHSILCRIITLILITIGSINWSARVEAETYLSWELRTNMANIQWRFPLMTSQVSGPYCDSDIYKPDPGSREGGYSHKLPIRVIRVNALTSKPLYTLVAPQNGV